MKYWRKPLDLVSEDRVNLQKIIIEERCKGCGFCIAFCPRGVLRLSSGFNKKGYHFPEVVDISKCADCHFCDVLCPEFAIYTAGGREKKRVEP